MRATFSEVTFLVDGLIAADGLSLLAGKRKLGKSWWALQVAVAVASGVPVLGRKTQAGRVIYLALEDGGRRLQARLRLQQSPTCLPIEYRTWFEPLDSDKGMAALRKVIQYQKPRLVIIDTLAAMKTGKTDENAAGPMADLMNNLRRMAQDLHCGILVILHHGKGTSGDVGDDMRGSSAVAAAADVNLGLYRDGSTYTLKAEGRDIEEVEFRVAFDAGRTFAWHLVGDAREMARAEADAKLLEAVRELGEAGVEALAAEAGVDRTVAQRHAKRLHEEGKLNRRQEDQRFLYSLVSSEEATDGRTPHTPRTVSDEGVQGVRGVQDSSEGAAE